MNIVCGPRLGGQFGLGERVKIRFLKPVTGPVEETGVLTLAAGRNLFL